MNLVSAKEINERSGQKMQRLKKHNLAEQGNLLHTASNQLQLQNFGKSEVQALTESVQPQNNNDRKTVKKGNLTQMGYMPADFEITKNIKKD